MARHDPREARTLGLWTAAWLGGFLLGGLLWLGDLSLQWPVLLVPVVWALVAVRPRGSRPPDSWDPVPPSTRTDTVERPALRPPHRDGRY
ncbi:hypothetical protein [Blastococcus brunescens]|uniref:DUF4175 domain-containing protein n=1 Tax=Blastococcus brunescens TaxID=1564165 RepID=A0ABZ1B3M3_9ACTN|nr:hypothetical protein [Blastococcus sp. BMG 8361]WRL64761.1 hypothetical protein U6N30_03060 [Blastococcus sp. BMG 8361]